LPGDRKPLATAALHGVAFAMARILVVDDEANILKVLRSLLSHAGHEPVCADSAAAALEQLRRQPMDLLISDLRLGEGINGLELLHEAKALQRHLPVVMITAYGSIEVAVQAMKEGACDFIRKPFKMNELLDTIQRALAHRQEVAALPKCAKSADVPLHFGSLVGESTPMQELYDLISRVAKTDATVLITGESGTGKELVAQAIHYSSRRADAALVPLNCAALPGNLLESEIFGHVAGAFTGATGDRDGLFLAANGGTLFLDEIGAMDLGIQAKFLRALQERKIRRIGENRDHSVDVRVLAATNESLEQKRAVGEFRDDLFYRISVIPVVVPPLRHRSSDIAILAEYFCQRQAVALGQDLEISADVLPVLIDYSWPGNVRELENAIACAAALCRDGKITLADLPPNISAGSCGSGGAGFGGGDQACGKSLRDFLKLKENEYMQAVLERTSGNRARAAEVLGISRATLYRKLPE